MTKRPKVLLIVGYFDWFSGYQEVGLARALSKIVELHVLAGDRVNPMFSDSHLNQIGQARRYSEGTSSRDGVAVTRLRCREIRSMVWSGQAPKFVREGSFDFVVQVMPGQAFPAAASFGGDVRRVVLYGDNTAMYAALSTTKAALKFAVFSLTKGILYRVVNRRALRLYGYTPNTLTRLRQFTSGKNMEVLPLAYDETVFSFSPSVRSEWRHSKGYRDDEFVMVAPGKTQPQKRIDELIRSVHSIAKTRPGLRLRIVGADDSSASLELRALVEELELRDVVAIDGFANPAGLNAAFNGSDLGIWPVMPAITIQQAMGTGLPVVLPDNDLVSHLVASPSSGRLYSPTEPLDASLRAAVGDALEQFGPTSHSVTAREERAIGNEWLSASALARRLMAEGGL